ncbi:MAG: HAEPLYID family protein [Candidatus Kapabacteria bacterium]|jgi:hypothetical protein|nr:HAEPLYID family protein [Candidatus Kapabacteria bacterium]
MRLALVGVILTIISILDIHSFETNIFRSDNHELDSAFITETQYDKEPLKILHAEPLYIDLIRDLGARAGEKEWNIGLGLTDNNNYDSYTALIEYEFAPIDRLGFEFELPFTFYYPNDSNASSPHSRLNSLKLATQYTFLVSDKYQTSMAFGYIHEFEFVPFMDYNKTRVHEGNLYNPFFVAAKRWGNSFHTLIYIGPMIHQNFSDNKINSVWQVNTNLHYMIPGTRNFIGVELNKEFMTDDFDMVIRPQMRVEVNKQLMIGIVTGIPVNRENQRFSSFLRIIFEPH